jgi:hypothetical protein
MKNGMAERMAKRMNRRHSSSRLTRDRPITYITSNDVNKMQEIKTNIINLAGRGSKRNC